MSRFVDVVLRRPRFGGGLGRAAGCRVSAPSSEKRLSSETYKRLNLGVAVSAVSALVGILWAAKMKCHVLWVFLTLGLFLPGGVFVFIILCAAAAAAATGDLLVHLLRAAL